MRLLLLTRHFPPEISGGARRPLGFVRGLRAAGVDVTLCAPTGIDDPQLIGVPHPSFPAVPSGVEQPRSLTIGAKAGNWARRHLLLPDPEIRWALRAVKAVKATGQRFDWVMTTSPPESLHVAGRLLKEHLDCRWLADVRDMWITRPQRRELENAPVRQLIETQIARSTLGHADALIAVSNFVMDEVRSYVRQNTPEAIIGHFAAPFSGVAEVLPASHFNIVHTGAITLSNPLSEFQCLLADFESLALLRKDVVLWLAGNLSAEERGAIQASPANQKIKVLGPVTSDRARALQLGADALALVSGRTSHALPGKFSEYLQAQKPILISAPGPWLNLIPTDVTTYQFSDVATWQQRPVPSMTRAYDNQMASDELVKLLTR